MSVGSALVVAILQVLYAVLNFYVWVLIIGAVMSWLIAFEVMNPYNRFVHVIGDLIHRITEPLLAPIRKRLPNTGPVDLSPLVLILVIFFVQAFIHNLLL